MDTNELNIIGNPENIYQQQYSDTCAIKSQQLILNDFGVNVTEDQLVQYSMEQGWYSGDGTGTRMGDVGRLLVDAGIPCTQRGNANIFDLTSELAQGHKVIVGVDSGELWDSSIQGWWNDVFNGPTPDHALIVAGIDMTDMNDPKVILTDPGTGEAAKAYPLDQFMDAWADSEHFMVSTNIPTPAAMDAFQTAGLDYHLPTVAGVDYPTFDMFHNYSHNLPDPSTWAMPSDPMALLYDAFDMYPGMPYPSFDGAIAAVGLPPFDSFSMPTGSPFDPMGFDYGGMGGNFANPITQDAINTLQDSYEDCMQYAQDAMEHGSPVTAQLFMDQAHDAQAAIDGMVDGLV